MWVQFTACTNIHIINLVQFPVLECNLVCQEEFVSGTIFDFKANLVMHSSFVLALELEYREGNVLHMSFNSEDLLDRAKQILCWVQV
jgi:hypothetical protein